MARLLSFSLFAGLTASACAVTKAKWGSSASVGQNSIGRDKMTQCTGEQSAPASQYRTRTAGADWGNHLKEAELQKYCVVNCFGKTERSRRCCDIRTRLDFPVMHNTLSPFSATAAALDEVTLVTHGSLNRLRAFQITQERWPGPKVVVLTFYNLTKPHTERLAADIAATKEIVHRWNNTLILQFIIQTPEFTGAEEPEGYKRKRFRLSTDLALHLYPINALRNLAVDSAPTNWVLPVDIDFVPSTTLYSTLREYAPRLAGVPRPALVAPHFEQNQPEGGWGKSGKTEFESLPSDFNELSEQLQTGAITPFHASTDILRPAFTGKRRLGDDGHPNKNGVAQTNYSRWFRDSTAGLHGAFRLKKYDTFGRNLVKYKKYHRRHHADGWNGPNWEPFVAVRRLNTPSGTTLPRYNEALTGRYYNKVVFVAELTVLFFNFFTVRQEFLVHCHHTHTQDNGKFQAGKSGSQLFSMSRRIYHFDLDRLAKLYKSAQVSWGMKELAGEPEGLYLDAFDCGAKTAPVEHT